MGLARATGDLAGGGTVVVGRDTRRSGDMLVGGHSRQGSTRWGWILFDVGGHPRWGACPLSDPPNWSARSGGDGVRLAQPGAGQRGQVSSTPPAASWTTQREAEIEGRLAGRSEPWKSPTGAGHRRPPGRSGRDRTATWSGSGGDASRIPVGAPVGARLRQRGRLPRRAGTVLDPRGRRGLPLRLAGRHEHQRGVRRHHPPSTSLRSLRPEGGSG